MLNAHGSNDSAATARVRCARKCFEHNYLFSLKFGEKVMYKL